MAIRMNTIGRRILNFKGIVFYDVSALSRSISYTSSKIDRYLAPSQVSRFVPPSSVNFQDGSISRHSLSNVDTPKPQILDRPISLNIFKIDLPMIKTNISYEDITPVNEIQDPKPFAQEEKHAVRMIVIRRRKMRVHKLKKFRRKMKFVIAKVKQRRRAAKEKAFQAELMAKINTAERFDPAVYVNEKISKANEVLIPKLWRGKKLPEFIIKDLIVLKNKKRLAKEAKMERRRNMNLNPEDYK